MLKRALTFIEFIMTMVIIGFLAVGAVAFISEILRGKVNFKDDTLAINLCRMEIEKTNNISWVNLSSTSWDDYEGYGYRIVRGVSYLAGTSDNVKQVTVNAYKPVDKLLCSLILLRSRVPPTVTTQDATNIGPTGATLNMTYDFKDYSSGSVRFRYRSVGTTTWTYTSWVARSGAGTYSEQVTGLSSGTQYEFYAQLQYDSTIITGSQKLFTTSAVQVPTVVTQDATNIGRTYATLNMTYDFKSYGSGTVRFGYRKQGTTTWTYTSWVARSGAGTYSEQVTGLLSNTNYDFYAQLQYDSTIIDGGLKSFKTTK